VKQQAIVFAADYLLFDTPTANYGGSGIKFNWEILKQQKILSSVFFKRRYFTR